MNRTEEFEGGMFSVNIKDGSQKWSSPLLVNNPNLIGGFSFSCATDRIYTIVSECDDDYSSDCVPQIVSVNSKDGSVVWKSDLELDHIGGTEYLGLPRVFHSSDSDDEKIVVYAYKYVYGYNSKGNREWSYKGGDIIAVSNQFGVLLDSNEMIDGFTGDFVQTIDYLNTVSLGFLNQFNNFIYLTKSDNSLYALASL